MADDIDDLLNEAAQYLDAVKLSDKGSSDDNYDDNSMLRSTAHSRVSSHTKLKCSNKNSRRESDVNAMIDDILDDNTSDNKYTQKGTISKPESNKKLTKAISAPISTTGQSKCFRLWLGGSENKTGISTAVYQRCCDSLRCTDCDFRISMFDNYQWHSSTDYLFLRNNMPDYHRLKSKLSSSKGFRAYACQCKWKSVKELTPIESFKDIKWVCGRHQQFTTV